MSAGNARRSAQRASTEERLRYLEQQLRQVTSSAAAPRDQRAVRQKVRLADFDVAPTADTAWYHDGTNWKKAKADSVTTATGVYVCEAVFAGYALMLRAGYSSAFSGLTAATTYYLTDTAGVIGTTAGSLTLPLYHAISTTEVIADVPLTTQGVTLNSSTAAYDNTTGAGLTPITLTLTNPLPDNIFLTWNIRIHEFTFSGYNAADLYGRLTGTCHFYRESGGTTWGANIAWAGDIFGWQNGAGSPPAAIDTIAPYIDATVTTAQAYGSYPATSIDVAGGSIAAPFANCYVTLDDSAGTIRLDARGTPAGNSTDITQSAIARWAA